MLKMREETNNNRKTNVLFVLILATAFAGFLVSLYLTILHYQGISPICLILEGCEKVLTSRYAELGGIPIALFGTIFYLLVIFLSGLYLEAGNRKVIRPIFLFSFAGFLVSLGLVYTQYFLIGEFCVFCMASAFATTLIFVFSVMLTRLRI